MSRYRGDQPSGIQSPWGSVVCPTRRLRKLLDSSTTVGTGEKTTVPPSTSV
jgi:hypothetical protein